LLDYSDGGNKEDRKKKKSVRKNVRRRRKLSWQDGGGYPSNVCTQGHHILGIIVSTPTTNKLKQGQKVWQSVSSPPGGRTWSAHNLLFMLSSH